MTELSEILKINITSIHGLINNSKIPYKRIDGNTIGFYPDVLYNWLAGRPELTMNREKYIERFRKKIETDCPETLKILRDWAAQFSDPWEPKKYYLDKVPSKKLGFVWYVRYLENGKIVPSHWCTHTNNRVAAEKFAIENRELLLKKYYERDTQKIKTNKELYAILKKYYSENSPYLQIDQKRGRVLSENARVIYHNFIIKKFIPYLRKARIKSIEGIDTPFLARFQNYLLSDTENKPGIKPQTVNHYISYISLIFDHLLLEGNVKTNPCKSLVTLKIGTDDQKATGCYEITKLKGVFNRKWKNELSYLLCLVIYTTNMRNSEIERIQLKDFIMVDDIHFLDIPVSKSKNGVRIVPIHDFVYRKLSAFIRKNKFSENDYIFKNPKSKKLGSSVYETANSELAKYTGYTAEQLETENITFYSGRHFWKTLMDSENLGDVEEYFMGHKVSSDVAKRYNHRDKQGKRKLLEKARRVFQILDKYIFIK
jgi:integrase